MSKKLFPFWMHDFSVKLVNQYVRISLHHHNDLRSIGIHEIWAGRRNSDIERAYSEAMQWVEENHQLTYVDYVRSVGYEYAASKP